MRLFRQSTDSGQQAEKRARVWLQKQGLKTVASNVRCRQGEVDLIMLDGDTLVFIEVRWRRNPHFGGALASVDHHKQRRLILAAQYFLGRHPAHQQRPCRFDVLGQEPDNQGAVRYQWIQNAFYSE